MIRRWWLALVLVLACGALSGAQQPVQGDVTAIGFPSAAGPVIRLGCWIPIQVHLSAQGSDVFAGQLRAIAPDLDGDRVALMQPQVTVTPDAGVKRFWCYALANSEAELPNTVDLLDADGALRMQLPLPPTPAQALLADDLLVLDISPAALKRLTLLESPQWAPGARGDGLREFYNNIVVAPLAARDLPDQWWGLEAVNVIVWDRPDQSDVSLAQLDALAEWVRRGGQLVIGVGSGWDALSRNTTLAPLLPLAGDGPLVTTRRLEVFRSAVALAATPVEFAEPIAVTTAGLAPGALRVLGDYGPQGPLNLIALRNVGSGRVIASAASLKDLLNLGVDHRKFFGLLLDLNPLSGGYRTNQAAALQNIVVIESQQLYDPIANAVGFTTRAALGGIVAFLFVAAYILLATLATWWWLNRHKRTHLSWAAFGAAAIVASGVSLVTVSGARALFSRGVQSLSVVDLEAGTSAARGPCLFGYATPIRQRVALSLAGEHNFLRPLARGPRAKSSYVTPARYAGVPTHGELDDVLLRATLKQVEGSWSGTLEGTVRGDLVADRRFGRLAPGSWLANDLGVELAGGYLLYIDPRQDLGGVPLRVAGLTTLYDRPREIKFVPPAANVLAVRLPGLKAGAQARELGKALYDEVDHDRNQWLRNVNRDRRDMPDLPTLWSEQQMWAGVGLTALGSGIPSAARALMLASTTRLYLPSTSTSYRDVDGVGRSLSTDGLPPLDLTHALVRGQAILLAWAEQPGPARLERNGRPLHTNAGLTLYRVRIPMRYEGTPPPAAAVAPAEPAAPPEESP